MLTTCIRMIASTCGPLLPTQNIDMLECLHVEIVRSYYFNLLYYFMFKQLFYRITTPKI